MNFFKSVFSNDPDPSNPPGDNRDSDDDAEEEEDHGDAIDTTDTPDPQSDGGGGGGGAWSFGGLIKSIASKSETVIQTYRRDLEEFGSGLKQETAAIRDAATRAVLDLPVSLETGASVAQESLESVGQAIDEFGTTVWRGTTEIISQGKEALNSIESDAASGGGGYSSDPGQQNAASSSKRYSRFETQVLAIQSDPSTFSDEPEDADDFQKWKSGFDLAEKEEEIDNICYENGNLEDLFGKLVPGVVNYDTFWSRYYYKVHKLKLAEDARADLVKRAILRDEEELTWEVDDEDEEEEEKKEESKPEQEKERRKEEEQKGGEDIIGTLESVETPEENKPSEVPQVEKHLEVAEGIQTLETAAGSKPSEGSQAESHPEVKEGMVDEEQPPMAGNIDGNEPTGSDLTSKTEDEAVQEEVVKTGESGKDNNYKEVPSQVSMPEEDDLEWDEIEDLGEHDIKKVSATGGSPSKVDLRKRLSALEEGEDLSWDIEDDEPDKP